MYLTVPHLCLREGSRNVFDLIVFVLTGRPEECISLLLADWPENMYLPFLCLQKGLKNVFDEAILAALEPPEPPKKKRCVIL